MTKLESSKRNLIVEVTSRGIEKEDRKKTKDTVNDTSGLSSLKMDLSPCNCVRILYDKAILCVSNSAMHHEDSGPDEGRKGHTSRQLLVASLSDNGLNSEPPTLPWSIILTLRLSSMKVAG